MDDGVTFDIGITILVSIAVVFSALFHYRIKRYWLACLWSGPSTALVFCVGAHLVEPDPFILIAFVTATFISFIISAVVGVIVHRMKMKIGQRNS